MAPTLINCTGSPVYVQAGDDIVELPMGRRPVALDGGTPAEPLTVTVGDATVTLPVRGGHVYSTLEMPPERDGVLYLVSGEMLARCPHRADFVAADSYLLDVDADDLDAMFDKDVLAAVIRAAAPVDADTPNIVI